MLGFFATDCLCLVSSFVDGTDCKVHILKQRALLFKPAATTLTARLPDGILHASRAVRVNLGSSGTEIGFLIKSRSELFLVLEKVRDIRRRRSLLSFDSICLLVEILFAHQYHGIRGIRTDRPT